MLLLAGPLAVLYFIAVGFSLLNDKRRNRNNPDAELSDDEASDLDLTPEPIGSVENARLPSRTSGAGVRRGGRSRVAPAERLRRHHLTL